MGKLVEHGFWWRDPELEMLFSRKGRGFDPDVGFSREEVEEMLPQIRSVKSRVPQCMKSSYAGHVLVEVEGKKFYVMIRQTGSVVLPYEKTSQKRIRTSNPREISAFEEFGYCF